MTYPKCPECGGDMQLEANTIVAMTFTCKELVENKNDPSGPLVACEGRVDQYKAAYRKE